MSFLKKLFSSKIESPKEKNIQKQEVHLSLDDLFVHNFINKGGKFLYCTTKNEVTNNLIGILDENQWQNITCLDEKKLALFTDSLQLISVLILITLLLFSLVVNILYPIVEVFFFHLIN